MARKKTITARRRGLFLEELRETGNVSASAVAGEIGRTSWYDLRDRDEQFAEEWDDAEIAYLDWLADEAIDRGVNGVKEKRPYVHVSGDRKETKFHTVTKKSDTLLLATLKARHPAFKAAAAADPEDPTPTDPTKRTANYANLNDDELAILLALQRKAHGGDGLGT